jgi:hypothetical protein
MIAHALLGKHLVAGDDRRHNLVVLRGRFVQNRDMAQTLIVESIDLIAELAGELGDAGLSRECVDSLMKLLISLSVAEEVGRLGKLAAFVGHGLYRRRRRGIDRYRVRSQSRGESFDHFAKLEDLYDVFSGLTAHHSAAVGLKLNETFSRQSSQRLTDGATADFEFSAQLAGHEALTGNKIPISNALPDRGDSDVDHGFSRVANPAITHACAPLQTLFMSSTIVGHLMKISQTGHTFQPSHKASATQLTVFGSAGNLLH